jgi:hypothetical protein
LTTRDEISDELPDLLVALASDAGANDRVNLRLGPAYRSSAERNGGWKELSLDVVVET